MDALLLREPAFVLERARVIESERQRSDSHAKAVSEGHAMDLDDASDEDADIQRYLEQAQALDARWPSSYVYKKLVVLQDIMEEMYRPEHLKSKMQGSRVQGHAALDDAPTPLMMSDLPLAMQLGLRMFFRITRSFQDPAKLATNYRLIVQVASKLPSMLASLPPLHLSPGFLDAPQSNAACNSSESSATEDAHVYSVFQQLFKILSDLLALPWNGPSSAAAAHSSTIVLSESERSVVLTAFIALSLKWGRLRHLLTGIRAVLESPDCFGRNELAVLTPLLDNVAHATVELRPVSYPDEDAKNGFLMSFGKGDHGKLGHGQCSHAACPDGNCTENKSIPTMVNATRDQQFVKIDSLSTHSVAILMNGDVMAWGNGDKYRLGHGTTSKEYTPRVIDSLSGKGRVTDIACGLGHTIALTQSGEIYVWGNGSNGRLGLGDTTDRSNPTQIVAYNTGYRHQSQSTTVTIGSSHQPLHFRRIYCGASHSLAISTDGRAFSWGKNNQGQCGHGHTNDQLSVEEVLFFRDQAKENVVHAAGGWEHTMFCTSSGRVYSCGCGYKDSRRAGIPPVLGHGDFDRRLKPTLIQHFLDNNEEIVKVACGWDHSLAVSSEGAIFSWGSGSNGKLGHGDEENCDVPTIIRSMVGKYVKDVKAGCEHSVMLTDEYEVWTCGQGDSGRLGHGDNQTQKSPKRIDFFAQNALKPVSIAVGDKYNLVLVEEDHHAPGISESKRSPKRAEKARFGSRSLDEVHPRRSNSLRHELMKNIVDRVKSIDENHGAEWILTVMEAFRNPDHPEKEISSNPKFGVCLLPKSRLEFILFLLGHIDRIATDYVADGGPDCARQISYDRDSRGMNTPSMICPFSIDTSHGAISALLDLLHYACDIATLDTDKLAHANKSSSSGDGEGLLKLCITLTCLRILKANLIKLLELASLNRPNCTESTRREIPMVANADKTLSTVHSLLLKLSSLNADELISMLQLKQNGFSLPLKLDYPAIAKEITREAAQALQTGFSKFYPHVLDRQRLLSNLVASASSSSCPSMETIALSGCLCEDDVMEALLLPLFLRKTDYSSGLVSKECIHLGRMNANVESVAEGFTASGLLLHMKSLLQKSVLQAVKQLEGAEKPHIPDCYLQLFTIIQMNCFSMANQFLMMGTQSETIKTEVEENHTCMPICSCIIDWLLSYIDNMLSESLSLLKRLHKASCQHEEALVWSLNNTFFHVVLPNAIESICVLFQSLETRRQDACDPAADEWESIQLRFVDQLGPYLLPIVKILDEINWKMAHLQDSHNQAEHEQSGTVDTWAFSDTKERNWAVDLEDVCGVLCGKLGYVVMSLSKRIYAFPAADESDQMLFAAFFASGRLLSHETLQDTPKNVDVSLASQDSKMFQWEETGVFEVENEVECYSNQGSRCQNGTDIFDADLLAAQKLVMEFIPSSGNCQSSFVDWFVHHLTKQVNVREDRLINMEAFKKALCSIMAVVAWYLDFAGDIRSYKNTFCQSPDVLVTELSKMSTVDASTNFWSIAIVICSVLSQEQIAETEANNIIENTEVLLKLAPQSAFFSSLKFRTNSCDNCFMHKVVFKLHQFLIKPINFSHIRNLISRRSRNLALYHLGLCLFHDLLRKLTISSTRCCLITELLRATEKESYSISAENVAVKNGFKFEFSYGGHETNNIEMTIENLFIRLAKQLSSQESSFDLKRKSLLAWLLLLRGKNFNSSWLAGLVAKSSIVHTLSEILADESDVGVKSSLHTATHAYFRPNERGIHERAYPNPCGTSNGYNLPTKLKSVEALIFGQSSDETLMLMARHTFYVIAMHLGRSDVFQNITISPLLSKEASLSLTRDPSQKDVLTPRTAAVSPRKRSTLPKKTIISTVEESIDQLYEYLFVTLQKLQEKLRDQVKNARRLTHLIIPDQSNAGNMFSHTTVFTIGNPIHVSPTVKQTYRGSDESRAGETGSDFTVRFWICLDYAASGQECITARTSQVHAEINEPTVWNCILALDRTISTSSDQTSSDNDDNYSLVVMTSTDQTNQSAAVKLMIRNFPDGSNASLNLSTFWTTFDIEACVPFGQWTHIAVVMAQHNTTPIFYLNGKMSNTKALDNESFDFVRDSLKWSRLVVGGSVEGENTLGQDLTSQSLGRSQSVSLGAVLDDVWIVRGVMSDSDIEFLVNQGPMLLQVKNHQLVETNFVSLLQVLSRLTQWDNPLQDPKAMLDPSLISPRWIYLLFQALEECPPDSYGQCYLLELLKKTLPFASELINIQVKSLGKIIFQSFCSLASGISEKTELWPDIYTLFVKLNELLPGERGRCFPTLPKQNELLYSVMQAHSYLAHEIRHSNASKNTLIDNVVNIRSNKPSEEKAYPESLLQAKASRLFCGVELIQGMWVSPVWKNEINDMFEMACLAANELIKADRASPFDNSTALALVVTMFMTAGYPDSMSKANKHSLGQIYKQYNLMRSPSSSELLMTKSIQSLLILLFSRKENNALGLQLLGRQELSENVKFKHPEDISEVDMQIMMLLQLKVCLLRLLMIHIREKDRHGLVHTFCMQNPTFCDQLFELASSSTVSVIKSALGPDCKVGMKRRGLRTFIKELVQRDSSRNAKMLSISDLEVFQWRLWETASSRNMSRTMWRDTQDLSIKSPIEVLSGDVELHDMQVKGISHFPTVRVSNAAIAANTGLWFYEVLLLTDGLFQIGFVDNDFVADSIQGQGVGDHSSSWAFDGFRCKKWHVNSYDYGESWNANDVVGVLLDTDRMEISFFLNGRFLGVAFTGLPLEPKSRLCPAISLNADRMAQLNIGSTFSANETQSSTEEIQAFRYLPILDFGNEQFSIQPVFLAVQNASVKSNYNDPASTLNDDSCAMSDAFDDDDGDDVGETKSNYDRCQFRAQGGIVNPFETIITERLDFRDGSNRQLWSGDAQNVENTERRTDLVDGLVNLGFPREWAARCATETDLSIDDSGAISWILEQMEKDATSVAAAGPIPPLSFENISEGQRNTNITASSILDMMMLQFGDRTTRSVDDLALRTSSHTLPYHTQQFNRSDDQLTYNIRNLRPHTESQTRSRTMHSLSSTTTALPVSRAGFGALPYNIHETANMNPFLCAELPSQSPSKTCQDVYSFKEANSRPLFFQQLNLSIVDGCIHDSANINCVMHQAKFAPNEVIPLWLAADVSLSVQYARELIFSLLLSDGENIDLSDSYELISKWISNNEYATRFKRFLKVLLGLENHEVVVNTMLNLDKRSAKMQSIRLQHLLIGLLTVELKRFIQDSNSAEHSDTSEKSLPLFDLLFDEIRQQTLSAFTSTRSHQSPNLSISMMTWNVLWTHWVFGVLLTHVEAQMHSAQLSEDRKVSDAAMKPFSLSCFSLPFFQLLASLGASSMRDALPWKYAAFSMMKRILFFIKMNEPEHVAPTEKPIAEGPCCTEQWLSDPPNKLVNATQVDHLMELFVTRFQKEKSNHVFFTDLTRILVGLLATVQHRYSPPSESNLKDGRSVPQLYIEEFSSTHASILWSYHALHEETAQAMVSDVPANDRGESFRLHHESIVTIEARRQFCEDPNAEWLPDKNVLIVCNMTSDDNNSLYVKGSFGIRNLAPDTRYSLRLVPIVDTSTLSLTLSGDEAESTHKHVVNVTEVFLQTRATPPFEFDANFVGKNLMVLNQNLTVKNLQNKKWRTVRTQASFDQGIHVWSVRIDACVSKNIFIGVCTSDANLENYIGSDAFGYGFLANKAVWHNKTKLHSYGEIFKQGDIIQVTLDCDAKSLAFSRNGENLGIAASNLKFNSKSTAGCKWYPAVSMYNKDDQITLIPPSLWPSTADANKTSRSQNACALPILDALQDIAVHRDALAHNDQYEDKLHQLYEKVFFGYQKWNRGDIICREIELGDIVAIDIRPSTAKKYGFAHGDSIFTEMGQCIVLGEYQHELWYEILDDGKREYSSWNLIACREMLENPNEFPVHRNHAQDFTSTVEMPLQVQDDSVQTASNSCSENDLPVEHEINYMDFCRNQNLWMTLSTDVSAFDRKVIELLDAIAVSRTLSDPHHLTFADIKTEIFDPSVLSFLFEGFECPQDNRVTIILARIGYLLHINRCIFRVIRFIMPEMNTFSSIEPYVKPKEGDVPKMNTTSAESKSVAALATTEIAVILESTSWMLPDPSDLSQLCQQSIGFLFQAQKDKLIDAELCRSSTPTGVTSDGTNKASDSALPESGIDALDLPRIQIQQPSSKPIAFWNRPRTQLPGSAKQWPLTKQSHGSLFAQLSEHLQRIGDTSQLRRAYETPFDLFSIYRAFDVINETRSAPSLDASDGNEEPQDENQTRTQNAQYLRLLEATTTEIQSPVFPLFVPVTTKGSSKGHGNIGINCSAYKKLELDVNTSLLSSKTTKHSTAQVLQWFFQFGQLLGIAWRSRVKLPLQFLSRSLWDHLAKPPTCVNEGALTDSRSDGGWRSDGNPDGLCRRSALHSVRKGLLSIVPSRCLLLSTASSLHARLCDTHLSLLSDLQCHAIYDRESELHHSFWVILEELTYLERRAMHQYLTSAKASRSETLESWIARHRLDPLEASSSLHPPPPFHLEICAPNDDTQDAADDRYPVVVVLSDHSSRLHLPAYSSAVILRQKLMLAVANLPFVL